MFTGMCLFIASDTIIFLAAPKSINQFFMILKQPIKEVFDQIADILEQLTDSQYRLPGKFLSGATIGQHVRHIIELFLCLENGYDEGLVNYEKRKRDYRIETDKKLSTYLLNEILVKMERKDKPLLLIAEDYGIELAPVNIKTNYYRELAYNLEHTIHHMALIRVGIAEVSSLSVPENFGVAYSTLKFRERCAQ